MSAEPMFPEELQDADANGTGRTQLNRRRFLIGSGMAAATVVVAGRVGGGSAPEVEATAASIAPAPAVLGQASPGDVGVARLAASLEVLAVGTYQAALDAATAGKLGTVPPAVSEYVTTAKNHHQAHLDSWNKIITAAGEPAVTQPHPQLKPKVDQQFAQVKDVPGAARLALMLEEIAAATYLSALPTLGNRDAVKQAASIQALDAKHAAILHYVLGEYPVPAVFAPTAMAASPVPEGAVDGLPRTS